MKTIGFEVGKKYARITALGTTVYKVVKRTNSFVFVAYADDSYVVNRYKIRICDNHEYIDTGWGCISAVNEVE